MALSFLDIYRKLHEADAPPPPAPGGNAVPPPPGPGAPDPLAMGGGTTPPPPPGGDPSMGGMPGGAPAAGGQPKIIKITTVWDALENALDGKVKKPKTAQHQAEKAKEPVRAKALST